jgi:4-amino-4-deoxychorismate lyase
MYRLLETIKVLSRTLQNTELHNTRMNRTRRELFGSSDYIDLNNYINFPEHLRNNIYKCRVIYSENIEKVEFHPYTIKPVRTLQLIECDTLEYKYKYLDRNVFDELLQQTKCDDILIVKHKLITDTSYSNIVFYNGKKWITPATPLLCGTKREYLLRAGKIDEMEISVKDLKLFEKASLINSMIDLEESPTIEIQNIY